MLFFVQCLLQPTKVRSNRRSKNNLRSYPAKYNIYSSYQLKQYNVNASIGCYEFNLGETRRKFLSLHDRIMTKLDQLIPKYQPGLMSMMVVCLVCIGSEAAAIVNILWQSRLKVCTLAKVSTALMAETGNTQHAQRKNRMNIVNFFTNHDTVVVDNSATAHISNKINHFVGPLRPSNNSVSTVGDTPVSNHKIGPVQWSWKYDEGDTHTYSLDNVCYLPNSPVSLLSVSFLAEKLRDSVNSRINSGMLESVLT